MKKRSGKGNITEESGPQRQQWANGVEYLMSCIAMSFGLGKIWRFPYLTYTNGGVTFIIPYVVAHFLISKPMYYFEMCIGQFVSRGPVKVWALSPALKGIGYGQVFAGVLVLIYYCSYMALAGFYLVQSFGDEFPWATCFEEWNYTCFDSRITGENSNQERNLTHQRSSSELFFYKYVLNEPSSIEDGIGDPIWRLIIGLFVAWLIIFLIIIRGVRSSGKASYILALFPYVVMIVLLIRGATLPGAQEGIRLFFHPHWEKLLEPKVWYYAVTQAFFTLNLGYGTIMMYSSYNNFRHDVHRDVIIITSVDTLTSLLGGLTIFSILGNVIYEMETEDISSNVRLGTGLGFVSYPDAFAKFYDVPQLFAVLFFLMIFVLGAGNAVAFILTVITVIRDNFPNSKYILVAVVTCVLGFVGGLVYVTPGGMHILTLVDFYGANYSVLILATFQIIGMSWIYGVNNFCDDLEFMLGAKTGLYTRICWCFFTPVIMIILVVYSLATMEPETHNNNLFPTYAYVGGWILFAIGVAQLPLWALIVMCKKTDGSFLETIKSAFRSSEKWRPQNNALYKEWKDFKEIKTLETRDESLWQKMVRALTGHSPLSSKMVEPSTTTEKL